MLRNTLFVAILASGILSAQEAEVPIEAWIEQLGSDSFEEREKASQRILARGRATLPVLREAGGRQEDLEIALRIEQLIEELDHDPRPSLRRLCIAWAREDLNRLDPDNIAVFNVNHESFSPASLLRLILAIGDVNCTVRCTAAFRRQEYNVTLWPASGSLEFALMNWLPDDAVYFFRKDGDGRFWLHLARAEEILRDGTALTMLIETLESTRSADRHLASRTLGRLLGQVEGAPVSEISAERWRAWHREHRERLDWDPGPSEYRLRAKSE